MDFIAAINEGEDIKKIGEAYANMNVTKLTVLSTIGVITGTSDLTLEELKIPGIDNITEAGEVFI